MVKKIRVIEDATSSEEATPTDRNMMEMAKTMDWKLWEILQIMQKLEKKIGSIDLVDSEDSSSKLDTNK